MGDAKSYVQLNGSYQGSAPSDLRIANNALQGNLKAFGTVNFAMGTDWSKYSLELFVANVLDERGDLSRFVQCGLCTRVYTVPINPRTIGLRLGAKF